MNASHGLIAATAVAIFSSSYFAALSDKEAKLLGTTLTPWGAEESGNNGGPIPAYTVVTIE